MSCARTERTSPRFRAAWIDQMINKVRSLPLDDFEEYISDKRNVWTCESCLRRAMEASLDLGRHILAKGFGIGVSEYKEIAVFLQRKMFVQHFYMLQKD